MKRSYPFLFAFFWLGWAADLEAAPETASSKAVARAAKSRLDAARKTYQVSWINYRQGRATQDYLYLWSVRWLEAEKAVNPQPAAQLAARKGHLDRMRQLEQLIIDLQRARQARVDEVSGAEFYRSEAELWFLQAKEKAQMP